MLWNKVDINFVRLITVITIFRLIIHPLLVFCIFYFFPSSISPLWINVAVLSSCLPVAATAFAMAGYYETFIKETSSSILVTTILSTISVSTILIFIIIINKMQNFYISSYFYYCGWLMLGCI